MGGIVGLQDYRTECVSVFNVQKIMLKSPILQPKSVSKLLLFQIT